MLSMLQGQTHQVYTGVCLTLNGKRHCFHVTSDVTFVPLQTEQILDYIDHYEPYDKAGSYGAQECLPQGMNPCSMDELRFLAEQGKTNLFETSLAADAERHVPIIESIHGSYFNVMGLPLAEMWEELLSFTPTKS